ncbi:MAG: thioredoxin domain-containing protein, partial [Actinomycetota bacterium]|nr:thioredoxin domain-containing protein [Actinomycetota bacterium]
MPNRLKDASSPYLLQHADNPVEWHEWGEEAFERARSEDKPVFLSVGYSSCHWCHVMAHESFEDDEVARVLNERFVSVKVDREERPDIDSVYMTAVQAMTGRGGWPMSVFLTPDGRPFFGGTYWPRDDRMGMPGFLRVLDAVWDAWSRQRDAVLAAGKRLADHLRDAHQTAPGDGQLDPSVADRAATHCVAAWDQRHGGFGDAPKFPQAMTIDFLLAHHLRAGRADALQAATHSLERMSRGGIYDHVGGGFARYSVDAVWLVPHFEKMLYDNALLLRAYVHAWQVTGSSRFRRIAVETADYLLRDMRHSRGGFFSATDADSEGVEGRFFVWDKAEFSEVVAGAGEDPDEFARFYGVTDQGNFEGHNILHEPEARDEGDDAFARRLTRVREALFERRERRVHPGLDDKVLTSWNALALGALAEAGAALSLPTYVDAARVCAAFLRDELVVDGRLRHTWKQGPGATVPAFLEDVAYLAQALLVLYEADFEPAWLVWARALADEAEQRFADGSSGAYFSTAADAEPLLTRPKDLWDNATPAGSSVMVDVHLRLAALTGDPGYGERAQRTLALFAGQAAQAPTGYGELLRGLERLLSGPQEVAVVGDPGEEATRALVGVYWESWRPGSVLAVG